MRIEHIDQVKPHLAGHDEFIVAVRDGYTIIDYLFTEATSFDDPVRRECRGIKFGPDGRVLARPLHKFFNINERPETQANLVDLRQPHVILDKLDGSMVHAAIVGADVCFMTRMGRTDTARQAERHLDEALARHCRDLLGDGFTPIFEFTAPDNRIVISYAASQLSLLAVRGTVTGDYLALPEARDVARRLGITHVGTLAMPFGSTQDFLVHVRALLGAEGYVLRFAPQGGNGGLWLKAKAEDYVLKHRSKEEISLEKNALALILTAGVDDVLPLLASPEADALVAYRDAVQAGIAETAARVTALVTAGAHLDQKAFAVDFLKSQDGVTRTLAFATRGGKPAAEVVRDYVLKQATSQPRVDAVRPLFGATWSSLMARARPEAG